MLPQLIKIGDFFIPTYGVLVTAGFLLACGWRRGWPPEVGPELGGGAEPGHLLRAGGHPGRQAADVHLATSDYYRQNPREIFSLCDAAGGRRLPGRPDPGAGDGLLLHAARSSCRAWRRRMFLRRGSRWDTPSGGWAVSRRAAAGAWSATGPGRSPSPIPWPNQLFGTPLNVPLHPTQLYEAGAEALIFVVLYCRFRRPHRAGAIIGLYLVLYSSVRFVVEFFALPRPGEPLRRTACPRPNGSRWRPSCWAPGCWRGSPRSPTTTALRRRPCPDSSARGPRGNTCRSWRCRLPARASARTPGRCRG